MLEFKSPCCCRERGARALEQRLAAEKPSAVEKSDEAVESV